MSRCIMTPSMLQEGIKNVAGCSQFLLYLETCILHLLMNIVWSTGWQWKPRKPWIVTTLSFCWQRSGCLWMRGPASGVLLGGAGNSIPTHGFRARLAKKPASSCIRWCCFCAWPLFFVSSRDHIISFTPSSPSMLKILGMMWVENQFANARLVSKDDVNCLLTAESFIYILRYIASS